MVHDRYICKNANKCVNLCMHSQSHSHVIECDFPCETHKHSWCVHDIKGERNEKLNKLKNG